MLLLAILVAFGVASSVEAQLAADFYRGKCPRNVDVEGVITSAVQSAYSRNSAAMPGVLRIHFHDCFVNVSSSAFSARVSR